MNRRPTLLVTIGLALALLLFVGASLQNAQKRAWEYKVIYLKNDSTISRALDSEGAEGWELINFDMTSKPDKYGQGGLYYFKRQK